jgi:hypothetical protein
MKHRLRTGAYWLFVATGFAQLGAIVAIGESSVWPKGVAVVCALVIWLGFGSRVAWCLFVAANSITLIATLALTLSSGGGSSATTGTSWGDVIVLYVGSAMLLAILLSPGMRHHLRRTPSTA